MNIHGQSILLLLSPFPSKGCQPVLCTYACISAVSASSRYVACFLVKLFLIPVSLTFACCSLFSASSLPFPQCSSFLWLCNDNNGGSADFEYAHCMLPAARRARCFTHRHIPTQLSSRRRAFERDTSTNTECALTAAHNVDEH